VSCICPVTPPDMALYRSSFSRFAIKYLHFYSIAKYAQEFALETRAKQGDVLREKDGAKGRRRIAEVPGSMKRQDAARKNSLPGSGDRGMTSAGCGLWAW